MAERLAAGKKHNEHIFYSYRNALHFIELKANLTKPMKLNFT